MVGGPVADQRWGGREDSDRSADLAVLAVLAVLGGVGRCGEEGSMVR